MDTKSKGDIGEQAVILQALKMGWAVLKPIGDRLPYDLVFDICGKFVKVQVKSAWFDKKSRNFVLDTRRTKTNRREMVREIYKDGDFDFAIVYVHPLDCFWVFPFVVWQSYKSNINLQVALNRQRNTKSNLYKNAWNLMQEWATPGETQVIISVKVGEASDLVIPSQALKKEGVET